MQILATAARIGVGLDQTGPDKSPVLAVLIDLGGQGGQSAQIGRVHAEPGRGQQTHQGIAVGVVAD